MRPRADGFGSGVAAVSLSDYFWGFTPPVPTQIPYTWLSPPFRARADQPINDVAITRTGGETAYLVNSTSIDSYGDFTGGGQISLATVSRDDPLSYATWIVNYYSGHRMRCPSLTVNIFGGVRTDAEVWRILGVKIGTRIQITGAPATWPEGTTSLIVEGIAHQVGQNVRTVTWNTSPVIGGTPGTVGPWFRLNGASLINGVDVLPF